MTRTEMTQTVELAFRRYSKEKEQIKRGFITFERIEIVRNALFLKELKNEELNEMWNAVHDFFDEMYCEYDENKKVIGFKPYSDETEFARDTQSAWSEVINSEAHERRIKGIM